MATLNVLVCACKHIH